MFLLACVLTPLCVGGALPWWTIALGGLVTAGLLAIGLSGRGGPRGPLLWLLAAPALASAAQLVPLPATWLAALSPQAAQLRGVAGMAPWAPLSVDAPATAFALCRAVMLCGIGAGVAALAPDRGRSRWLLRAVAAIGTVQAIVDGIHLWQGNDTSILGLYPLPEGWTSGLGTFVNRNHAASLLTLSAAVTAGLALESPTGRAAWLAALLLQLAALLHSHSRAGLAAAAGAAMLICLRALSGRVGRGAALLIGAAGSAVVAVAAVVAMPALGVRLTQLGSGEIWDYQKVRVWRDCLSLMRDFWAAGTGRGAFFSAFPSYRTGDEYVTVAYPASLPLQYAAELGVPAALGIAGLGAWLARDLWQRRRRLGLAEVGAAAGVLAVAAHDLAEFSLELPGVAVPAVACLAVVAARARRREEGRGAPGLTLALAATCALATGGAVWARAHLAVVQKWQVRRDLAGGTGDGLRRAEARFQQAQHDHPADFTVALLGAQIALQRGAPGLALHRANQVLALHPADLAAHRLAGQALAQAGRRDQAAAEMRLAAGRGWSATPEELAQVASWIGADRLIDVVAQQPQALRGVADLLAQRGHPALAARARYRAQVVDPGHAE